MQSKAHTPEEYIEQLPENRKEGISKLRTVIKENLPRGFEETINYGMIGYVVPHSLYPNGYHADPKLPLPFIHLASQKNYISLYHSGLYTKQELLDWFASEYPKQTKTRLNMGKSCIRFKKPEDIPYDLIAELSTKISPEEWIRLYEKNIKSN